MTRLTIGLAIIFATNTILSIYMVVKVYYEDERLPWICAALGWLCAFVATIT